MTATSVDPGTRTSDLLEARPPHLPPDAPVMTRLIEHPPGSAGTPPHRHSGPVFGYVVTGEMLFELEGEAPRAVRAGEAFWEPGGDVVHWQDANTSADEWLRFVVVMVCPDGVPMLVPLSEQERAEREHLRVPAARD